MAWSAPADLGFADWLDWGRRLGRVGRAVGWWLGDWLGYGNARYGERYARAARITGYDTQTLMNMVYVAARFEASRRREKLSWSHHAEVAALSVVEQERWLDLAEAERMSVRSLRTELRLWRRRATPFARDVAQHRDTSMAAEGTQSAELVCPSCGSLIPLA